MISPQPLLDPLPAEENPGHPVRILRDGYFQAMQFDAPFPMVERLREAYHQQLKKHQENQ